MFIYDVEDDLTAATAAILRAQGYHTIVASGRIVTTAYLKSVVAAEKEAAAKSKEKRSRRRHPKQLK